jgi:hypothetical protein
MQFCSVSEHVSEHVSERSIQTRWAKINWNSWNSLKFASDCAEAWMADAGGLDVFGGVSVTIKHLERRLE